MIQILIRNEKALLLRPLTDLRMENVHEFHEEFLEIPGIHGKDIFLDFSRMQFVDSSGIGTLIKISEEFKKDKGHLYLVGLNRALHGVFRLSGLMQIFQVLEVSALTQYFAPVDLKAHF